MFDSVPECSETILCIESFHWRDDLRLNSNDMLYEQLAALCSFDFLISTLSKLLNKCWWICSPILLMNCTTVVLLHQTRTFWGGGGSNMEETTQVTCKLPQIPGDWYEKMFCSLTTSHDNFFLYEPPNPMFEASVVKVIVTSHDWRDLPFKVSVLFNHHF